MKNQIKYFALFCLAIISLMFPDRASAYDFEYNGLYYDVVSLQDMTCALTKGTEEYKGTVVIPAEVEYNNRKFKVTAVNGDPLLKVENLTIPNTINEIHLNSYYLGKLTIQDGEIPLKITGGYASPKALKTIYLGRDIQMTDNLFAYNNIEEITIGPLVTVISKGLFTSNRKLSNVTFSNNGKLMRIEESAFSSCDAISTIILPNSVEYIGEGAFDNNPKLNKIELSQNLKSIGRWAFYDCPLITNIILPLHLEDIGYSAFRECSITELSIPKSVNQIGEYAFSDNPLSIVTLEDADKTISFDSNALPSVNSAYIGRNFIGTIKANKIDISLSVSALNFRNFRDSKNLTSISIPESVKTISNEVFYNCSSLESLEIPSSVTYVGTSAFYGCTNLKSISFGSNIKDIGANALTKCDNLSEITLFNTVPPSYLTAFTNKQYMDVALKVPHGSLTAYQNADNWKNFWNITEMEASGISEIRTDNISILTDANAILITGAEAEDAVTIVGIDGNIRYSGYDRIISGLTPGLYIVKVRDCIRKVIVK